MARVLQEFFEATGYDAAGWTETVPGTCVVDEDEASSAAGNPPGWGGQCLKVALDGGGVDCYTYNVIGEGAVRYTAMDFKISACAFDVDAQQASAGALLNGAGSAFCALVQLVRSGGVNYIAYFVYHDGTAQQIYAEVLTLNKLYRWEVKWDDTANTWELWTGNVSRGSGTLTGAAATRQVGIVICGDMLNSARAVTTRYDRVEVDDASRIGGWAISSGLVGGKIANNPVLLRGALI